MASTERKYRLRIIRNSKYEVHIEEWRSPEQYYTGLALERRWYAAINEVGKPISAFRGRSLRRPLRRAEKRLTKLQEYTRIARITSSLSKTVSVLLPDAKIR